MWFLNCRDPAGAFLGLWRSANYPDQHWNTNHPLLSSPRCWFHHQPWERGRAIPGVDARHHRSTNSSVHTLFSHASWSLWLGISNIQILQALQARKNTTKSTGTESCFFILTCLQLFKFCNANLLMVWYSAHTGLLHWGFSLLKRWFQSRIWDLD